MRFRESAGIPYDALLGTPGILSAPIVPALESQGIRGAPVLAAWKDAQDSHYYPLRESLRDPNPQEPLRNP